MVCCAFVSQTILTYPLPCITRNTTSFLDKENNRLISSIITVYLMATNSQLQQIIGDWLHMQFNDLFDAYAAMRRRSLDIRLIRE